MRLKGWIWFLAIVLLINVCIGLFGRQYRFDSILIHHSAGRVGDLSMIRAMHKQRGWSDAAYHLLLSNGSTEVPLGYLEASGRFKSLSYAGATQSHEANVRSLHLCIVGDYEGHEVPEELRPALADALLALCDEFSIDPQRIVFHRDVNNTACPGKHLTKDKVANWMTQLPDTCSDEIKAQHRAIIESSSLSFSNYPNGLLVVQGCATLIFCIFWFGMVIAFRSPPTHSKRSARSKHSPTPRYRSAAQPTKRKKPRRNRHR